MVSSKVQAVRYDPAREGWEPSPAQNNELLKTYEHNITIKQCSSVFINSKSLSCRSNLGRLIDICKGVVALCESVLYSVKKTEVISICAVLAVAIPLAPSLKEHRDCTWVLVIDSFNKSGRFWYYVVVNLKEF